MNVTTPGWRGAVLLALAMVGCAQPAGTAPRPTSTLPSPYIPADWPLFAEVVATVAPHAMVSTSHPTASEVGTVILRKGGNAVDAAVAIGFALAVVHPAAGNIGGGGFMVIRFTDGTVRTLDYRETAPGRATHDMYLDAQGKLTDRSLTGHLAAGVPGSVAGLAEAQAKYGKLTLAEVLAPAVRLAGEGFVLDQARSQSLGFAAERLAQFPASRRQFLLTSGKVPPPGTLLVQSDLARTLQAIADSGPQIFYKGYVADLIVAEMERGGGIISKHDLAAYRPLWRDPVMIQYRGYSIYSMAPVSSGGVTMAEILNMYEELGSSSAFASADQVHLMGEAMRRAFTDRNHFLADPAYVEMPLDKLLSKSYAAQQAQTIDRRRATRTPALTPGIVEGDHTTHYSVVDADGNAVSVTTTINGGYGNGVTVAGAGFLLNNEMDDFSAAPGQPNMFGLVQGEANAIQPGKRMLSSMTPSIVLDPQGDLFLIVGTPGGSTIITTVAQVISNIIDHGMTLGQAIAAPRIHHQALPDMIFYEQGGLRSDVVNRLEAMGHTLRERGGYSGFVTGIMRTPDGWIGVADPRGAGGSAGY